MMSPASFRIATLFPDAAMRPRRPADPLSWLPMEENVSVCGRYCQQDGDRFLRSSLLSSLVSISSREEGGHEAAGQASGAETYG